MDPSQAPTAEIRHVLLAGLPAGTGAELGGRLPAVRLREVASLDAALAAAATWRWDLAVVAHDLPGGGEALVRRLRSLGSAASLPVVYLAPGGLPAEEAHRLVESLRVARLLFPPLDPAEISEAVSAALPAPPVVAPPRPSRSAAELSAAVAGVWARFRGATLERVSVLEQAAVALLSGELDPERRRGAEREAHKLAGSVGTFGFAEASRTARSVELLLEGAAPLEPSDALRISELVNRLRAQLEGDPPAPAAPVRGPADAARPRLLVVGPDREFSERVAMEAEGRGFEAVWRAELVPADLEPSVAGAVVDLAGEGARALDLLESRSAPGGAVAAVVVSAEDSFAARVESARRGGRSFLGKGTPPAQVVDCVAQHLAAEETSGRVLVVDDDPVVVAALETLLESRGIRMVAVSHPREFWTRLSEVRPDLVVLDQDMPDLRGEDLCRVLRAEPRWRELPVLFLTGTRDAAAMHRIFDAGANDVVRKPFVGPEVLTRIAGQLDRARSRAAVLQGSGPAGLPTRPRASEEITRLIHIARRQEDDLVLVRLELDGFGGVRDRLGEAGADEVLRRFAVLLQTVLRAGDVVGGWGGAGFVAALYGLDAATARDRLEEVLDVAREAPIRVGDEAVEVTLSMGLACAPRDGSDLAGLCRSAEAALADARAAGGDRVATAGRSASASPAEVVDVVLVEDDEVLAELLVHALGTHGIGVTRLADGEAARRLLCGADPALLPRVVLLDVDLPALDGLSVLREMARCGASRRAHVIMLTARSTEREVLEALGLGAAEHVAKPFSIPVLLQRVRNVLREEGEE